MGKTAYIGNGYSESIPYGPCGVVGCAADIGCGLNACITAGCGANVCGADGCAAAVCGLNACPLNGCAPVDGCLANFTPLPGPFSDNS